MGNPYISVIVATYNRQEVLSKSIEGLLKQKITRPYEIIIVDNNSTDQTKELVESRIQSSAGKLKYLKQETPGKSSALNMGIQESEGGIIAFTDDDVLVDELWLSSLLECFEKNHCDGIGGRVLPLYPPKTPLWVIKNPDQMAGTVVIYDQGELSKPAGKDLPRFIGANCAFKKAVFEDIGLFRTDLGPGAKTKLGEDEEFYERLVMNKKSLYYCAQSVIMHPVDLNRLRLKNVAEWHINLGRFEAKKEFEKDKLNLILIGGVPRYIVKGIAGDLFFALLNSFNILKFRYYFRAFFRKLGMILEYRDIRSYQ